MSINSEKNIENSEELLLNNFNNRDIQTNYLETINIFTRITFGWVLKILIVHKNLLNFT